MSDNNAPAINETCKSCNEAIVRERTAVQVRKAGYEPFWCCSWACVAKIAAEEAAD